MSSHNEIRELLPGAAAGVNDPSDLQRVTDHVAICDSCRNEYLEMQETFAAIAESVPLHTPPADLRNRVLTSVLSDHPTTTLERKSATRPGRISKFTRGSWRQPWAATAAVAASALVAFIAFDAVTDRSELQNELQTAQAQLKATQDDDSTFYRELAGADATVHVDGSGPWQAVDSFVALKRDSDFGAFVVRDLPAAPKGKSWQVWVLFADGSHESIAVKSDHEHVALIPLKLTSGGHTSVAVAVTAEPRGGSSTPSGLPLAHASFEKYVQA